MFDRLFGRKDDELDALEESMNQKIANLEARKNELIEENKEKIEKVKELRARINELQNDE